MANLKTPKDVQKAANSFANKELDDKKELFQAREKAFGRWKLMTEGGLYLPENPAEAAKTIYNAVVEDEMWQKIRSTYSTSSKP